jgi:hypothetical protein
MLTADEMSGLGTSMFYYNKRHVSEPRSRPILLNFQHLKITKNGESQEIVFITVYTFCARN